MPRLLLSQSVLTILVWEKSPPHGKILALFALASSTSACGRSMTKRGSSSSVRGFPALKVVTSPSEMDLVLTSCGNAIDCSRSPTAFQATNTGAADPWNTKPKERPPCPGAIHPRYFGARPRVEVITLKASYEALGAPSRFNKPNPGSSRAGS